MFADPCYKAVLRGNFEVLVVRLGDPLIVFFV